VTHSDHKKTLQLTLFGKLLTSNNIFWTMHLHIILVGNQPDTHFLLIHLVVCLTTGPKPLPKRALHFSSMIHLFKSSTCFKQLCAHPQENNCMNTTSGIITLKISEWSKITKITRIHCGCIAATMYSSYFQSDYTRSCIHTTVLLRMCTQLLETCRGFK